MKNNSLKFKKAIGYWDNYSGYIIVQLEDGRYGGINTSLKMPNGHFGDCLESYTRGRTITENIPKDLIEKARQILESPNLKVIENGFSGEQIKIRMM